MISYTLISKTNEWVKHIRAVNCMVAPYINNIKHFIVQLIQTNYKILRLLEYLKL